MKILLIGSGGREHALAVQFHKAGHQLFCIPGNPGILQLCQPSPSDWSEISPTDLDSLGRCAQEIKADLTVVGPEQALEAGIVNHFQRLKLPIFGPTSEAARLESSKAYAKAFMLKYGIPTAKHFSCHSAEEAVDAAREIAKDSPGVVVKPSGLTAGKGVTLCRNLEEARTAIDLIMTQSSYGKAGTELVVEEYLEGQEVSILAFCDGLNMRTMPAAQDHKALCDGDVGPNTGGMGAYAPAPCATASVMEEVHHTIIERTQKGLRLEGISYTGVLYFGLMLTERGPKVLEYNCRFGDPEAQAVLALLDSDLAETMLACVHGRIQEAEPVWSSEHAACVVMCSKGYPGPYAKGALITGIETAEASEAVFVYHAGTAYELDKTLRSADGRVLGVTARAADLESAIDQAYKGVKAIDFEGKFFRTDIAAKAVKAQNAPL